MDLTGHKVAFFDGSDLKLVYISETVKNNLQVRTETGRKFKIPAKNILTPLSSCTYEQFSVSCSGLLGEINSASREIETELLWEMVDASKEYSCDNLTENYFGEKEAVSVCSMFLALLQDSIHFKRKGILFTPRTSDQAEEQKTALRRKQEKEAFKERVIPWLQETVKADKVETVPDEFKSFLNLLEVYLTNRKANEASRTLAQITGENSLKETVYDILVKCSVIDSSKDRFLLLAGIDEQFSKRVLSAAEELSQEYSVQGRLGFTDVLTFSIDDEDTRDIDDALSLQRLDNGGLKVGIHIADVTAYINRADILDDEAAKRVTSIYLPTGTVHMFPSVLSQNLLSLTAGDKRPAISFFVTFDKENIMIDWEVKLTEVKVDHKLSYEGVDELLNDNSELSEVLLELLKVSDSLKDSRLEKGAALFNRPELKIKARDGEVKVKVLQRNSPSRNMVSEFMILANCTAALYCARNDVPVIYRVQEKPEGLPEMDPDVYDPILFEQSIRCMKKSRLSLHPQSHGGLGADFYIQMTSPIRRFTDLVMQRQLSAFLRDEELPYESEELMSVIAAAEAVNGDVRDVQRQSENHWLHVYISEHMKGNEYEATVISKAPGGCVIELGEIYYKTKLMTTEKLKNGSVIKVKIEKVRVNKGMIQMALCK